jgi:hypothetical protein
MKQNFFLAGNNNISPGNKGVDGQGEKKSTQPGHRYV